MRNAESAYSDRVWANAQLAGGEPSMAVFMRNRYFDNNYENVSNLIEDSQEWYQITDVVTDIQIEESTTAYASTFTVTIANEEGGTAPENFKGKWSNRSESLDDFEEGGGIEFPDEPDAPIPPDPADIFMDPVPHDFTNNVEEPVGVDLSYLSDGSAHDSTYWVENFALEEPLNIPGTPILLRQPFWQGRNDWLEMFQRLTPTSSGVYTNSMLSASQLNDKFYDALYHFYRNLSGIVLPQPFSKFKAWASTNLPALNELKLGAIYATWLMQKPCYITAACQHYLEDGVLETIAHYMVNDKVKRFTYHWMDFSDVVPDLGTLAFVADLTGGSAKAFLSYVNFEDTAINAGIGNVKAIRPTDYKCPVAGIDFNSSQISAFVNDAYADYNLETFNFGKTVSIYDLQSNVAMKKVIGIYAGVESAIHEIGHAMSNYATEVFTANTIQKYNSDVGLRLHDYLEWKEITGWENVTSTTSGTVKFKKTNEGPLLDNGKEAPVSTYGATSPAEDFAESFDYYVVNPELLKQFWPKRYAFMEKYVTAMTTAPGVMTAIKDASGTTPKLKGAPTTVPPIDLDKVMASSLPSALLAQSLNNVYYKQALPKNELIICLGYGDALIPYIKGYISDINLGTDDATISISCLTNYGHLIHQTIKSKLTAPENANLYDVLKFFFDAAGVKLHGSKVYEPGSSEEWIIDKAVGKKGQSYDEVVGSLIDTTYHSILANIDGSCTLVDRRAYTVQDEADVVFDENVNLTVVDVALTDQDVYCGVTIKSGGYSNRFSNKFLRYKVLLNKWREEIIDVPWANTYFKRRVAAMWHHQANIDKWKTVRAGIVADPRIELWDVVGVRDHITSEYANWHVKGITTSFNKDNGFFQVLDLGTNEGYGDTDTPDIDMAGPNVNVSTIRLKVWDWDIEDGDVINIYLGKKLIEKNYRLRNNPTYVDIELEYGTNTIVFEGVNAGNLLLTGRLQILDTGNNILYDVGTLPDLTFLRRHVDRNGFYTKRPQKTFSVTRLN